MDLININRQLAQGKLDTSSMFPHLHRLNQSPIVFAWNFGLDKLPDEPGILLIRGPRQYGKSSWLEQQLATTIEEFGAGSGFYLNGDFLAHGEQLAEALEALAVSFPTSTRVKRIFIDEITAIKDWEQILKRLVDRGTLRDLLVVTTGSKATDLRRGSERLPGRKGKLARTTYFFTPISYAAFHKACHSQLGDKTLHSYLLAGGAPIACTEIALHGRIPEYVTELLRDWVEGEVAKAGRHRSALINILQLLFRFGATPVGQAKLAREAGLANNVVAQGYIELLSDLGCVLPAYPWDTDKGQYILRKPCKYHFVNLLAAWAYSPRQVHTTEEFEALPREEQAIWYEWAVAQELYRRASIAGSRLLDPLAFWQSKAHEIDFYDPNEGFIEVKLGSSMPLEFSWFPKQFPRDKLRIINRSSFSTEQLDGLTLEAFLLSQP